MGPWGGGGGAPTRAATRAPNAGPTADPHPTHSVCAAGPAWQPPHPRPTAPRGLRHPPAGLVADLVRHPRGCLPGPRASTCARACAPTALRRRGGGTGSSRGVGHDVGHARALGGWGEGRARPSPTPLVKNSSPCGVFVGRGKGVGLQGAAGRAGATCQSPCRLQKLTPRANKTDIFEDPAQP